MLVVAHLLLLRSGTAAASRPTATTDSRSSDRRLFDTQASQGFQPADCEGWRTGVLAEFSRACEAAAAGDANSNSDGSGMVAGIFRHACACLRGGGQALRCGVHNNTVPWAATTPNPPIVLASAATPLSSPFAAKDGMLEAPGGSVVAAMVSSGAVLHARPWPARTSVHPTHGGPDGQRRKAIARYALVPFVLHRDPPPARP